MPYFINGLVFVIACNSINLRGDNLLCWIAAAPDGIITTEQEKRLAGLGLPLPLLVPPDAVWHPWVQDTHYAVQWGECMWWWAAHRGIVSESVRVFIKTFTTNSPPSCSYHMYVCMPCSWHILIRKCMSPYIWYFLPYIVLMCITLGCKNTIYLFPAGCKRQPT